MVPKNLPVLGVREIDADHRRCEALLEGAASTPDAGLASFAEEVERHLAEHFGHEEALMQRCNFFAAPCHKGEHDRVLSEAAQARRDAAEGRLADARRWLVEFLPGWLEDHTASMDSVTMSFYRAWELEQAEDAA